ncbi:MAG: hypothetical protein ACE5HE_03845 [Phycisphaerae bacterium]
MTRIKRWCGLPSSCELAARRGGALLLSLAVGGAVGAVPGCASIHRETPAVFDTWDPGVEVRFPAAVPSDSARATGDAPGADPSGPSSGPGDRPEVYTRAAPDVPMPPVHRLVRGTAAVGLYLFDQLGLRVVPRPLKGVPDRGDTKYTLIPGTYAFQYEKSGFTCLYGDVSLYPVSAPRARDFIRHASIAITPSPAGQRSVLTDAELQRARNGDVVTKVVFMADLRAIRDRLDDIDRALREIRRVRASLEEQLAYWDRKFSDRRLNSRYSSEFGWGVDIPAMDLALLQTIVGPERYHWHRMNEAEDQVHTNQELISQLDLPQRNLEEERTALTQLLNSVDVLDRRTDMMILAPSFVRPYHDPVDEVHFIRGADVWADNYRGKIPTQLDDWIGPWGKLQFPYLYSGLPNALLSPALRSLLVPSTGATKNIGEVLMVVQVGTRRPWELGGHSWVGNP